MAPPKGTFSATGAIIFWLYIVAALVLTTLILRTIYTTAPFTPSHRYRRAAPVFGLLALISFATLSYNMLHVLILNYQSWEKVHAPLVPLRFCTLSTLTVPGLLHRLWTWSATSTLFRDFGDALIGTPSGWRWSYASLIATMLSMSLIGSIGSANRVKNLWAYFALAEILPVSFALNLFVLALLATEERRRPTPEIPVSRTLMHVAWTIGYVICLHLAPDAGDRLMAVILVARGLLLAPFFLGMPARDGEVKETEKTEREVERQVVYVAFLPLGVLIAFVAYVGEGWEGLHCHPAVSALGYDFILCVVSWIAWLGFGQEGPSMPATRDKVGKS